MRNYMVSRELIRKAVRSGHVIAVHMKGDIRKDGPHTRTIYVICDMVLDEYEEKQLIENSVNGINTDGLIRVKAIRTSELDLSLEDSEPKEYVIDTRNIMYYESQTNIR